MKRTLTLLGVLTNISCLTTHLSEHSKVLGHIVVNTPYKRDTRPPFLRNEVTSLTCFSLMNAPD